MASYGYYPCINKPTRVQKQSATLIDHVWTNDFNIITGAGILLTDVADHFALVIHCKGKNEKCEPLVFTYRDYKNMSHNICYAMEEAFNEFDVGNDPNLAYDTFLIL